MSVCVLRWRSGEDAVIFLRQRSLTARSGPDVRSDHGLGMNRRAGAARRPRPRLPSGGLVVHMLRVPREEQTRHPAAGSGGCAPREWRPAGRGGRQARRSRCLPPLSCVHVCRRRPLQGAVAAVAPVWRSRRWTGLPAYVEVHDRGYGKNNAKGCHPEPVIQNMMIMPFVQGAS